jgi:hypothetical protein
MSAWSMTMAPSVRANARAVFGGKHAVARRAPMRVGGMFLCARARAAMGGGWWRCRRRRDVAMGRRWARVTAQTLKPLSRARSSRRSDCAEVVDVDRWSVVCVTRVCVYGVCTDAFCVFRLVLYINSGCGEFD